VTRILKWVGAIAGLALVAGLVVMLIRTSNLAVALAADAAEARADTTKWIERLGVWERRAVQAELRATTAEDSLKLKPKASISIRLKIDTVYKDTIVGSLVVEDDSVRRSAIDFRQEPVQLQATAELPPAGRPGRLVNARLGIDPITIVPRVSCSSEKFNGIHRAHVTLDSLPRWVTPEIREAQADAQVCNPRGGIQISLGGGWKWTAGAGILGLLIGAVAIP